MAASKVLWNHHVYEDKVENELCQHYRLKTGASTPSNATHLHHLVSSILIATQLRLTNRHLLMDQLSTPGPILPYQLQRLKLVRRLLVAVEAASMLNNADLCFQIVIKCYGLLAPLVQHYVDNVSLVGMLIHCHTVLAELPEAVFGSKVVAVTAIVHHMMAAMGYYVGKVSDHVILTCGCEISLVTANRCC